MYQPDINTYLEAIRQEFESLKKDNKALKQENLKLMELNNHYMQKLQQVDYPKKHTIKAPILKLGSDWSVEGDQIFEITLAFKLTLDETISSVATSYDGKFVAFICGGEAYVVVDQIVYKEEDNRLIVYDKNKRLKKEVNKDFNPFNYPKLSKSVYCSKDSPILFVCGNGCIRIWDLLNKSYARSISLPDVKGLLSVGDTVYAISIDRTLRVYEKEKLLFVIATSEELEGPLLQSHNRDFVYCRGRSCLVTFDLVKRTYTSLPFANEAVTDMAILTDLGFICSSSKGILSFYKAGGSPRLLSSTDNDESNYCLTSFKNVLVVGHKTGMTFYDIKNKRKMKVNLDGMIFGIGSCNGQVVIVEDRNTLKVWRM